MCGYQGGIDSLNLLSLTCFQSLQSQRWTFFSYILDFISFLFNDSDFSISLCQLRKFMAITVSCPHIKGQRALPID